MRIPLCVFLLCCLPLSAGAAVYKWVDADGTVHFSDTPREGAEQVHVPPPQTYTPAPLPPITPRPEAPTAPAADYTRFDMTSPSDDQTLRDNTGAVNVSFAVDPPLKVQQGHRLVVLLDGEAQSPVQGTSLTLQNVERGTHSLQGRILDDRGQVLASSKTIKIHLHRQSVLLPNRARPAPP